jgi:hypothetical protein
MSGIEPIIAAEAAAATAATAATATTAAAVTEAAIAEAALAEAAKQAAAKASASALEAFAGSATEAIAAESLAPQLALEQFAGSAADAMLADALAPEAALQRFAQSSGEALTDAATRPFLPPGFEEQAYEKFLRQGMDADMPGATMRSIQAGLQNNALNTIGSLPQYMGMPAPPPGAGKALQAARLLSPQQDRGTRTSVSPPMLNKGREVNLGAPIAGLLGGAQMPKRRRLSLI